MSEQKHPSAIEQVLSEYILENANLKIYNKELEAEVDKLTAEPETHINKEEK